MVRDALGSIGITLALGMAVAQPHVAVAQGSPGPVANAGVGGEVAEVIVTAQRREQRLQDVPISISVLGAEDIAARNIRGIDRLDTYTPNLRIYQGTYTATTTIAMRGSAEINPAPYFDPVVGMYVDGVYVGKSQGNLFSLPDLERIEVLRGPQGTLYGRNTFAGAINLVSRKPSGQFGGSAKVGGGNYGARLGQFSLDLPAAGPFSARLAGSYDRNDGFVKVIENPFANVATARPANISAFEASTAKAGRVAVRFAPSETLTADYSLDISRTDATPRGSRLDNVAQVPLAGAIFDPASPAYAGALIGGTYRGYPANLYLQPGYSDVTWENGSVNNAAPFERVRINGNALTINWDAGPATLKSISSVRNMKFANSFDLDGTPLPLAGATLDNDFRQWSQELQASGSAGALSYTTGLFYFHERGNVLNRQQFFGNATTSNLVYRFETDAWAAYGQADYTLADRWTLTGGLRYSSERKDLDAALSSITEATGAATTVFPQTSRSASSNAWTPTAIVRYDFSRDANVYAKFARGFKSGGFSIGTNAAFAITPYRPEFVNSFEIGTKLRLVDGLLQLNAAAFTNDVKDLQVTVFAANGTFTASVVDNAAKARIKGGELELVVTPSDRIRLAGTLGYTDAQYRDYLDAGVDVSATRAVAFAPKISGTLSSDVLLLRTGMGAFRLLVDYSHTDAHFVQTNDVRPRSATVRASAQTTAARNLDLVDVALRITDIPVAGNAAEFSIWSKNVFDNNRRVGGVDFGAAFGNLTTSYYNRPRTVGADFTVRF